MTELERYRNIFLNRDCDMAYHECVDCLIDACWLNNYLDWVCVQAMDSVIYKLMFLTNLYKFDGWGGIYYYNLAKKYWETYDYEKI